MKHLAILLLLLVVSINNSFAQNYERSSKKKVVYLNADIGLKYFSKKDSYEEKLLEFNNSFAFSLGAEINLFDNLRNIIGIEFLSYKYGKTKDGPVENVWGLMLHYRRNYWLSSDIYLFPQLGLSILSNDPALMLSNSIEIGVGYNMEAFEIIFKSSFRINLITLSRPPNTLVLGINLKM